MLNYTVFLPRMLYKKFYGYLWKELLSLLLLSVGIFTFILVLSRIGKIADLVINRGVGITDILALIIYSSPAYLSFTLPMAFLLSTIVSLGRLSSENEILALKANGINLRCLFIPISVVAVGIFVVSLLNTTFLQYKSGEAFRNTLVNIAKKGISIDDKEGVFNDAIPGIVIYIDKVDAKNRDLYGIVISDERDEGVKQTISATKGAVNLDLETLDLSFVLENGSIHRWEKKNDIYRNLSFSNYVFSMNLDTVLPHNRELRKKDSEMALSELRMAMTKAKKSEDRYGYALEIYNKFSVPFSCVAFLLLTVPLGIKRKTEGKFSAVVYSLLIFICYYILMAVTQNVGKRYLIAPLLVSFTPNIIFCLLGLQMLRHLNDEQQFDPLARMKVFWESIRAKA
jgi:lipopolysaccharide export system permease protein